MNGIDSNKITDKLANSLTKLYKVGGLALVFIFIGILTMIFAFINPSKSSFATPMFIIGSGLIIASFFLFIIVQYHGPIKTRKLLRDNKETLDSLQNLSIELTKLIFNTQSYCYKNIEKIASAIDSLSPIVKPFLGENGLKIASKIEIISKGIVEYSDATEKVVMDIKNALENGDFKILEKYRNEINNLNSKLKLALKDNN
jgi:hypothetical protein